MGHIAALVDERHRGAVVPIADPAVKPDAPATSSLEPAAEPGEGY